MRLGRGLEPADEWEMIEEQMRSGGATDPVAVFLRAVRETYQTPPSEQVAERHLAAVVAAVRTADPAEQDAGGVVVPLVQKRSARRVRTVLAFAAALLVGYGMVAGLAYARVITIPEPLRGLFAEPRTEAPVQPAEQPLRDGGEDATGEAPTTDDGSPAPATESSPVAPPVDSVPGDHPELPGEDSPDGGGGDSPDDPGEECDGEIVIPGIGCTA